MKFISAIYSSRCKTKKFHFQKGDVEQSGKQNAGKQWLFEKIIIYPP